MLMLQLFEVLRRVILPGGIIILSFYKLFSSFSNSTIILCSLDFSDIPMVANLNEILHMKSRWVYLNFLLGYVYLQLYVISAC